MIWIGIGVKGELKRRGFNQRHLPVLGIAVIPGHANQPRHFVEADAGVLNHRHLNFLAQHVFFHIQKHHANQREHHQRNRHADQ